MYGVCRLHCLKELHLANNGIMSIEGLKELTQLVHLNLEGNNIKTIEHLNTNIKLEYLNISDNSIGNISDISFLKCLKVRELISSFQFLISFVPFWFPLFRISLLELSSYERILNRFLLEMFLDSSR